MNRKTRQIRVHKPAGQMISFVLALIVIQLSACGGGGGSPELRDAEAPTAVLEVSDGSGLPLVNGHIDYGEDFILSAKRSSDAGGGRVVGYRWQAVTSSGGGMDLGKPIDTDSATLRVSASTAPVPVGVQEYELIVIDDSNNVSKPVRVEVVVQDSVAPTAVLEVSDGSGRPLVNGHIDYGEDFILSAKRSSDAGGGRVVGYRWQAITSSGGGMNLGKPIDTDSATLRVSASTAPVPLGVQEYELIVIDDSNNVSKPVRVEVVVQDSVAPTAVLEVSDASGRPLANGSIAQGQDFMLSAKRSIDAGGGSIARYHWTASTAPVGIFAGTGTVITDTDHLTVDASHVLVPAGTQTYRLVVEDDSGNLSSPAEVQVVVFVPNQPPSVVVSLDHVSGFAPLTVNFDASGSSDADGTIASYAWDFGDGDKGGGAKVSHTYQTAGDYSVALTVTDDDGASASLDPKLQVQVLPAPVVTITPASVSLEPTGTQQFDAQVSGASNTAVVWSLEKNDCGSLDATGLFTAGSPAASCKNVVRAVSQADDRVSATAEVAILTCSNATYTVDDTNDTADANAGDKVCADAAGKCTLRAAVEEANACAGPNTVAVPAGTYVLTRGQLLITEELVVTGAGPAATIVDGNASTLVFHMNDKVASATLEGMTVRNGVGGINSGAMSTTIRNAHITHNTIPGDSWGGGLDAWQAGATTVVENSEITFNKAGHAGAIKFSNNNLVLRGVTIANNRTDNSRYGAIVDYSGNPSSLTIENSTIAGNEGTGVTLSVAQTSITNSTIAGSYAAGINAEGSSTVDIVNSILYGNGPNCSTSGGVITSGGHNIDSRNTCGFAAAGDRVNTDPRLGPLADNGGPTRTRGLQSGSPAIDAGDDTTCLTSDQRGVARPAGTTCDIGAYEDDGTALTATCLGSNLLVTSTLDAVDANIGDGLCDDGAGNCTLRAAVQEADACPGSDVIDLPAGTYALTLAGLNENMGAVGDLDIHDDLVINGTGAATTIVDASAPFDDRIFHVLNNVSTTLDGLTLQGVNINFNVNGGGIATGGELTVNDAVISGNSGGNGAGIYASDNVARVTISNSTLSNNTGGYGGAVYIAGTLNASGSTFSGNTASTYGGAIYGHNGAMLNIDTSLIDNNGGTWAAVVGWDDATINITDSTVSNSVPTNNSTRGVTGWSNSIINITRSTISGNEGGVSSTGASGYGGGSVLNITDSTIAGNIGTGVGSFRFNGAGIYSDGTVTITGSTISNNRIQSSLSGGGGGAGLFMAGTGTIVNSTFSGNINSGTNSSGGAISSWDGNSRLSLRNTTFSANQSTWAGGHIAFAGSLDMVNTIFSSGDCDLSGAAAVKSNGHNIDGGNTCGLTNATDMPNTDPLLSPLADHGGPTQTHALQTGSPAIDAADDTACPATDQRGVVRPQGVHCDIGAYEAQ